VKSKKQKTKWHTPLRINMLGIIFGTISIIIGFLCSILTFVHVPSFIRDILYGAGASFVAGAILNIISEYRIGNLLIQTVMNAIYETAASARRIRYGQSIKFTFKELFEHEGKTYLKLDCIHSYRVHNESTFDKKTSIDTFNDLNIPKRLNERLPSEYKTQFENVTITHSATGDIETFSPNNPEHKNMFFEPDEYGRPRFIAKNIRIDARKGGRIGWIQITYRISNAHYLKSSHSWYFQELSDGLELTIENKMNCPNSHFSLIINHPNREEIEFCNEDSISNAGQLKETILRNGKQYLSIKTNFVFLPYQGFSLQWGLEEYAKSLKEKDMEVELANNVN
jgi:hypothetical protein